MTLRIGGQAPECRNERPGLGVCPVDLGIGTGQMPSQRPPYRNRSEF